MRILACGDVVGRSGVEAVVQYVPQLRKDLALDLVIVNGENAAGGFGINQQIYTQMTNAGVDIITTGDHAFDHKDAIHLLSQHPDKIIRALNFPASVPGKGTTIFTTIKGKKILVVHVLCQVFMKTVLDSPFPILSDLLIRHGLKRDVDAIVIDIHGEASSEKMALAMMVDGHVSLVFGSHTHVPTADTRILARGTGYQTDAGMCGCYDSVIGFEADTTIRKFQTKIKGDRLLPAKGEGSLCGVVITVDDLTGLASSISPVRLGGFLPSHIPHL